MTTKRPKIGSLSGCMRIRRALGCEWPDAEDFQIFSDDPEKETPHGDPAEPRRKGNSDESRVAHQAGKIALEEFEKDSESMGRPGEAAMYDDRSFYQFDNCPRDDEQRDGVFDSESDANAKIDNRIMFDNAMFGLHQHNARAWQA